MRKREHDGDGVVGSGVAVEQDPANGGGYRHDNTSRMSSVPVAKPYDLSSRAESGGPVRCPSRC
jgi:hypothetical protein